MTKRQVWRYYCDHCGKGSLAGGHMRNHELHCTANPERKCRMHGHVTDEPQRPISELRAALNTKLPDSGLADLRRLAGNCPMCILSALRQSGIQKFDPECPPPEIQFNYKAELKAAWATANEAAQC